MTNMKNKFLLLTAISIFLLVLTLYWLAMGFWVIGCIFLLFRSDLRTFVWIRERAWIYLICLIIGFVSLAIVIRVFVFEVFSIPSGSMEDSLLTGDKVLVSKLHYGPKIPGSPFEIPWVNLLFYINKEARAGMDSTWWGYRRLGGLSEIRRNDVVVFNHPDQSKIFYVKRCVGLPGSILTMQKGIIYNHGKELPSPLSVKNEYTFWPGNTDVFQTLLDSLEINSALLNDKPSVLKTKLVLNGSQFKALSESKSVDSTKVSHYPADSVPRSFPYHESMLWSIDNWGPVLVPKKGKTIRINPRNYALYEGILGFNDQGQFAQRYWQQNPVMCGEITSMSFDNNQQTSWNNTIEAGGSVSMTGGEVHLNASNSQGGQTATGRSVNTIPATKFECEQTPTGTTTCLSRDCQ